MASVAPTGTPEVTTVDEVWSRHPLSNSKVQRLIPADSVLYVVFRWSLPRKSLLRKGWRVMESARRVLYFVQRSLEWSQSVGIE